MARQGSITYDGLPISSGGAHSLRHKGFVDAYNALQAFVDAISLEPEPQTVFLELFDLQDGSFAHFLALCSEFDLSFRRRSFERQVGDYRGIQWEVEPAKLSSLVDDLERLRPIPNAGYAGRSLVVHVNWKVVISDRDGLRLPFQSRDDYFEFDIDFQRYLGESFVYSRISETSTANLFLSLPFEEASSACIDLVKQIGATFPARLSSKHWKLWSLTKRGNSYVGRKIAAPFD